MTCRLPSTLAFRSLRSEMSFARLLTRGHGDLDEACVLQGEPQLEVFLRHTAHFLHAQQLLAAHTPATLSELGVRGWLDVSLAVYCTLRRCAPQGTCLGDGLWLSVSLRILSYITATHVVLPSEEIGDAKVVTEVPVYCLRVSVRSVRLLQCTTIKCQYICRMMEAAHTAHNWAGQDSSTKSKKRNEGLRSRVSSLTSDTKPRSLQPWLLTKRARLSTSPLHVQDRQAGLMTESIAVSRGLCVLEKLEEQ